MIESTDQHGDDYRVAPETDPGRLCGYHGCGAALPRAAGKPYRRPAGVEHARAADEDPDVVGGLAGAG